MTISKEKKEMGKFFHWLLKKPRQLNITCLHRIQEIIQVFIFLKV